MRTVSARATVSTKAVPLSVTGTEYQTIDFSHHNEATKLITHRVHLLNCFGTHIGPIVHPNKLHKFEIYLQM